MIVLWIAAAVMIAVALVMILPPMVGGGTRASGPSQVEANVAIHRQRLKELESDHAAGDIDNEAYQQASQELEQAMLEDVAPGPETAATLQTTPNPFGAAAVAAGIPLVAFGLYMSLGNPAAINAPVQATPPTSANTGSQTTASSQVQEAHDANEMVDALAERLRAEPNDPQGWKMLARSYVFMNRLPEAGKAYAEAYRQGPNDIQVMVGYAQVLARLNSNQLAGEPALLLNAVLEKEPSQPQALWLAGIAAFQSGDNTTALDHWKRLQAQGPLPEQQQQVLNDFVIRASGQTPAVQTPPVAANAAPAPEQKTAASGSRISVNVSLAPELVGKASPEHTLFIFARAAQGPRMPLAIVRKQVKDLPVEVTLDDSMAMMPGMNLSRFPQVVVGARISKTGNATAQPGDLEGISTPLKPSPDAIITVAISKELK